MIGLGESQVRLADRLDQAVWRGTREWILNSHINEWGGEMTWFLRDLG